MVFQCVYSYFHCLLLDMSQLKSLESNIYSIFVTQFKTFVPRSFPFTFHTENVFYFYTKFWHIYKSVALFPRITNALPFLFCFTPVLFFYIILIYTFYLFTFNHLNWLIKTSSSSSRQKIGGIIKELDKLHSSCSYSILFTF